MTRPQNIPDPSGMELAAAVVDKITDIRRQYATLLDDIAEMQRQQVAKQAGYPSLQAYLVHATRMSRRSANRLVAQAEQTTETTTPTGHLTPAPLPKVRELVHDGAVDGDHIDAIAATIKQLPEWAPLGVREIVESHSGRHRPHQRTPRRRRARQDPARAHRPIRPRTRRR